MVVWLGYFETFYLRLGCFCKRELKSLNALVLPNTGLLCKFEVDLVFKGDFLGY